MKYVRTSVAVLACACVVLLPVPACQDAPLNSTGDSTAVVGTGNLRLLITDKPFPFDLIKEANITITEIQVRRADGQDECETDAECDDDDLCTVDACADAGCTHEPEPCDDSNDCTTDSCDADNGRCVYEPVMCDDGFTCVGGDCAAVCVDGDPCDDGDACTVDACVDGACASDPIDCDDQDPCTVDTCNEVDGSCNNDPVDCGDDADCVDGDCVMTCVEDADCDDDVDCTDDNCEGGLCQNEGDDCDDDDDGDEDDDDSDDDSDDGGSPFITIFSGERTFNLLDLQNGKTDLLADAEIPAGNYDQMRIIVTQGEVVLDDEDMTTFLLTVPSGSQTGIKLHFEFTVTADEGTTLLLDVDVSKAFLPVPGGKIEDPSTIREFKFKPSLAMRLINVLDAGTISGTVIDPDGSPLSNVTVTAFSGDGDDVSSTATDSDGTYALGGLPTGEYSVEFTLTGFETAVVEGVSTEAGEETSGVDATLSPE